MIKKVFENDLITGMQQELRKQASANHNLVKAAECLHAALEIFEDSGLQSKADQILNLLLKIAQSKAKHVKNMPSIQSLLEKGITHRDMKEFTKSPVSKAKVNIVLRDLGFSEHDIAQFIGVQNVMDIDEAKSLVKTQNDEILEFTSIKNLERPEFSPDETIEFTSVAARKKKVSKPGKDLHTKNLTPEKMVANLKNHGTVFNMTDDGDVIDINNVDGGHANKPTFENEYQKWLDNLEDQKKPGKLNKENIDPNLSDLLDMNFDESDSDDNLLNFEIKEDSLEAFEKEIPLTDFEDEIN